MLTFFTTAKPFCGHHGIIQRNALKSWRLLHPDIEVILFGDDEGASEVARELGLRHEPETKKNEFGSNLVNHMFFKAQELARHEALCYVNCDIILLPDFGGALEKVRSQLPSFLMVGRRWDTDIVEPIDFCSSRWIEEIRHRAITAGRRRDEWGLTTSPSAAGCSVGSSLPWQWAGRVGTIIRFGKPSIWALKLWMPRPSSLQCIRITLTRSILKAAKVFGKAKNR